MRWSAAEKGGEGFKASLALVLGLSEEIQAQKGAVRIETMFVDEGFGTLDDESLASALYAFRPGKQRPPGRRDLPCRRAQGQD